MAEQDLETLRKAVEGFVLEVLGWLADRMLYFAMRIYLRAGETDAARDCLAAITGQTKRFKIRKKTMREKP